ncbi:CCA tRNA nucleotidyltransferase [Candidatus Phytoplasma asteris]|uniref:CCA tRNA nucleotidyltransferase n=1 Tax=Candidatus Phytoplasma asteris TaxID=85620 RepID=A0ABZ2YHA3_9MOLU
MKHFNQIKTAQKIITILKTNGFEAFIVGGTVRDYLLKINANEDIDITTNAAPKQIKLLLCPKKTTQIQINYGSLKITFEKYLFEITTYRKEGTYKDYRHPSEIFFTKNIHQDLLRRDFTINALLMDETGKIFDFTPEKKGKTDLKKGLIRTIKDPFIRFQEDPLRILRAFYFQSKLCFCIEKNTKKAIIQKNHLLAKISSQRIYEHLEKIITHKNWHQTFKTMIETKTHLFLPQIYKSILCLGYLNETRLKYIQTHHKLKRRIFWSMSLLLNNQILASFPFTKQKKKIYQNIASLSLYLWENIAFNLFKHGLKNCLLANQINYLLQKEPYEVAKMQYIYQHLPIKTITELNFSWKEVLKQLPQKPKGTWIKHTQKELITKVLNREIPNIKERLINFVLSKNQTLDKE